MEMESKIEVYIRTDLLMDRKTPIQFDESLISTGVLDSLTLLQVISFLEEEFDVSVDDAEMDPANFETINDMVAFVKSKQ